VRSVLRIAGVAAPIVTAMVIAEIPALRTLAAWIDAREWPLLIAVAVVVASGFALFFIGMLKLLMDRDEPLTHAEAEDVERSVRLAARPVFSRASSYRVIGSAAGRGGSESFALQELKAAWRSGAVWRQPLWRSRAVTTVGALLLFVGICAVIVVVGPPWLKVLFTGLFVFVAVRFAHAWMRL
jgi:hypothetical protein